MITEEHRMFATEVVALARKMGMTGIRMHFKLNLNQSIEKGLGTNDEVTMNWSEGRHGCRSEISLYAERKEILEEKIPLRDRENPSIKEKALEVCNCRIAQEKGYAADPRGANSKGRVL